MSNTFIGFDTSSYPGDGNIAWFWAHGFRIVGCYLNHHRGGSDPQWIAKRPTLASAGWGTIPIYLGWQTVDNAGHHLPPPSDPVGTAKTDAAEAIQLATSAGLQPGSSIFFDLEDGTVPSANYATYLLTWQQQIQAGRFVAAMYGSHLVASWAQQNGIPFWAVRTPVIGGGPFDPNALPVPSIDPGCIGMQFRLNTHVTGNPTLVDLDVFALPDPSDGNALLQAVASQASVAA